MSQVSRLGCGPRALGCDTVGRMVLGGGIGKASISLPQRGRGTLLGRALQDAKGPWARPLIGGLVTSRLPRLSQRGVSWSAVNGCWIADIEYRCYMSSSSQKESLARWSVEYWIDDAEAGAIEYSSYWNDSEVERTKEWDVRGGQFGQVEDYLGAVGLSSDLRACLLAAQRLRGRALGPAGVDLAAGTLWAVPALLQDSEVERLWCVEYSRHRLLEIGPLMLDHYEVDPSRVVLCFGSFYDLRLPTGSLDFAFLSQAFHHADRPAALLAELRRVLAPGGVVMIVGEHRLRFSRLHFRYHVIYAARAVASLLPSRLRRHLFVRSSAVRKTFRPSGSDLIPTDPVLGDHFYTLAEYTHMFGEAGFRVEKMPCRRNSTFRSFVLLG